MTTLPESRRFESHLSSCGTSAAGAQWVKTAVDPFHDVDLDVIGMPDSTSGRSVVYAVTSNLTLDRPSHASGAWDCHIAFTPAIAEANLCNFDGVVKTAATASTPPEYHPGCAYYTDSASADTLRESNFLTACSVPSGNPTFFNKNVGVGSNMTEEYQGLGVNKFLDKDGSSIIRITGAAFEVHNTTEDIYKSGSVTSYKIAREADECLFTWGSASTSHRDTVAASVSNGPPTDAATAKLYNGHTWDARDGCLIPGVLDAGESDGEKSLPRMHIVKATHDGIVKYWAPAEPNSAGTTQYALGITPRLDTGAISSVYNDTFAYRSPPTIVPEMMVSGAYFTGLSEQTKLTLTLRVFVEVFPAAGNALVPLAHPSNPYDAKALQCYQEIMSHMRSGYRVDDNAFGDYFRKAIAVARTVGQTMMPILPPKIAAAVKVADKVAAKADRALEKAQKVEDTVKTTLAEANKITPRVRNRARTQGKAMP